MDLVQQLQRLGRNLDQRDTDVSKYSTQERIFAIGEAERIIAAETECLESTYAFPTNAAQTIYDLPEFILKPYIMEYRLGNVRYMLNVQSKRWFTDMVYYGGAGSIPRMYDIFEKRIEFYRGAVNPTVTTAIVGGAAPSATTITFTGVTGLQTEGYIVLEPGTANEEKVHYEGIVNTGGNDIIQNVRRGQCGTYPRTHAGGTTGIYCNMVIRYYRTPELPVVYSEGTISVALNGTAVTGVGTTFEGNTRPGWSVYPGALDDVVLSYHTVGVVYPTRPGNIGSIGSNTALTLAGPWKEPAVVGGAYTVVSKSEFPEQYHELAPLLATSSLKLGISMQEAFAMEGKVMRGVRDYRMKQRLKNRDLYPKIRWPRV